MSNKRTYPFRIDFFKVLIEAAIRGETVNYLELPSQGGSRFNVGWYLARIGYEEARQDRPPLTAVVVGKRTGTPGEGFTRLMSELNQEFPGREYGVRDGETPEEMALRARDAVYAYWRRANSR